MTLTRYSKWVQQSGQASESNKLDAFVIQNGGSESMLTPDKKKQQHNQSVSVLYLVGRRQRNTLSNSMKYKDNICI